MTVPTRPGLYVHEDDATQVHEIVTGYLYALNAEGWWRGDTWISSTDVPDRLIRLVPEVTK